MEAFSTYSFGLSDELKIIYQRLSNQPEREYKLADESKPIWKLWHEQMEEKVWNEPSNLLRATYAKFKGAAARIALVLHCTNAAIVNVKNTKNANVASVPSRGFDCICSRRKKAEV